MLFSFFVSNGGMINVRRERPYLSLGESRTFSPGDMLKGNLPLQGTLLASGQFPSKAEEEGYGLLLHDKPNISLTGSWEQISMLRHRKKQSWAVPMNEGKSYEKGGQGLSPNQNKTYTANLRQFTCRRHAWQEMWKQPSWDNSPVEDIYDQRC